MSQANEYSPNNNTSQNIDIYQRNKINQTQYSSYVSREQSMYEPYSLHTPYQSENFFSTPNQNFGYLINNQNFNQNDINNLNNEKNILINQNNFNNNKAEMNNNSKNDVKENKNNENEDNIIQDPDEKLFEKEEDKKKDDLQNGEEEPLSSESDKNSDNEKEFTDHLLAQYEKVKRVKNKWKVYLLGCVVQKDKKECICGRVTGDLEREW